MARNTAAETRGKILDAAYRLFYRRGFGRVGVDEIAELAGITKRTLYYHYPSKDDLVAGMLQHQHELARARILSDAPAEAGDAAGLVARRFADLLKWIATRGWTGSGFTRLAMELADLSGHPARRMAKRHKLEIEAWLAAELARSGEPRAAERAREVSILSEGALVMALITGDQSYATLSADMARRLMAPAPTP